MSSPKYMNEPLLSVIIPVFNTESYLTRCIDSVKAQTYKNIEIIVVDDCSTGPVKAMVSEIPEVTLISHETNRGLYRARISGYLSSHGDYVCFLDSDDYVSPDFYRTLVHCAIKNGHDIVAGQTIFEKKDGSKWIRNQHESCFEEGFFDGIDACKKYYSYQGSCFVWHTVWNKIYSRRLWQNCINFFDSIKSHIVMTEDVLFSSILFFNTNGFSFVKNEGIHYCENNESSTNNSCADLKKFKKNMSDLKLVFSSVQKYLIENNADSQIIHDFEEFHKYYSRLWRSLQEHLFLNTKDYSESRKIIDSFYEGYYDLSDYGDHYFEILETKYDDTIEKIKNIICSENTLVVSFDVFDTLVVRDKLFPSDVLDCLDELYHDTLSSELSFKKIRNIAESELRKKWWDIKHTEDFTLKDIYAYLVSEFGFSEDVAERMYSYEVELETTHCFRRDSVADLFELSRYLGKKVSFTSDMYLEEDVIKHILSKNGYSDPDWIFVSSKEGLTKYSGNLYKKLIETSGVHPHNIVHIGDNWHSDFLKSSDMGIVPIYYPKCYDSFKGVVKNVRTNRLGYLDMPFYTLVANKNTVVDELLYKQSLSLVINKFFDNPYPSYNSTSDYNGSPSLIGYYPVGMHILDIGLWIHELSKASPMSKIVFLSRDGYLPKIAYDIITSNGYNTEYVACSRKSVLPHMISNPRDLYDLPIEYRNHSQCSLSKLLDFCLKDEFIESNEAQTDKFSDYESFRKFIQYSISVGFSKSKLNNAKDISSAYYRQHIPPNSIVFDMGYSGRIPAALSRALGYDVTYAYVYKDSKSCHSFESLYNITIKSLYNYVPFLSGFFREYLLSEQSGSCTGFHNENGTIVPTYAPYSTNFKESYVVSQIQKYAIQFIKDYVRKNPDLTNYPYTPSHLSFPFETMLSTISDFDRTIFINSYFDDMTYGGSDRISVSDLWGIIFSQHYSESNASANTSPEAAVILNTSNSAPMHFNSKCIRKVMGTLERILSAIDKKISNR